MTIRRPFRLAELEPEDTNRIYSQVGKLTSDTPLIVERPFHAPHHTASSIALIGG